MDFYEVVRTRKSLRFFKKDPIPEEVLSRVLEAARVTPSWSNRQLRKFILVKDETLKRKMISEYK